MNFLLIGDIMGRPGRKTAQRAIEEIRQEHEVDLVIANGENLAHGAGMTQKTYDEMREAGVDFFTSGNHIYDKEGIIPELQKENTRVIRPANFPPGNIGQGYRALNVDGKKVLIVNLIGRVFMHRNYDCPFLAMDRILREHEAEELEAVLVDFHAEATSEKVALKHYLDGRVTALWGTHTHVPTADEEVSEKGTAYQSDLGMTGPSDSVIGVAKESVVQSFLKQVSFKLEVPEGPCVFNALLIESKNRKAVSVQRIQKKYAA